MCTHTTEKKCHDVCDAFCDEECDSAFDTWLLIASVSQHTPFLSYLTSGETNKFPPLEQERCGISSHSRSSLLVGIFATSPLLNTMKPYATPLT